MTLAHTEVQAMLDDTVRTFMADEGSISRELRVRRDDGQEGFGRELWRRFAEAASTGEVDSGSAMLKAVS